MPGKDALQTRPQADRQPQPQSGAGTVEAPRTGTGPWPSPQIKPRPAKDPGGEVAGPSEVAGGRVAARHAVVRRLLAAADVAAAALAFAVTTLVLSPDGIGIGVPLAIVAVIPICKLAGLYDRDEHLLHKTTLDEAPNLTCLAGLYTLLAFLAGDALVDGSLGRGQALFLWVFLALTMIVFRALARRLALARLEPERCLMIGHADAGHRLAAKLGRCVGAKATVVGRVPLSARDLSVNELPVLGGLAALERVLDEYRVDRVVIAPGGEDSDRELLDAIMVVKRTGVQVSVLPSMFEAVGSAYVYDEVEGATLLGLRPQGLARSSALIKRGFDLLGAVLILAVLAPLMALIALAVKLDSRGPVLFRQRRVGRGEAVFEILKFRTMVDGAEAQRAALADRNEAGGGLFKIEGDPRVTRVGRLLRSTSLDELPQLWNVIRGEMSLVGPRPLVLDEDALIAGLQRHRLLVPPGVTGLWQVYGSARIPLEEMVKIDYLYGANWSLWLDLKILLRTIPFALGRRGL